MELDPFFAVTDTVHAASSANKNNTNNAIKPQSNNIQDVNFNNNSTKFSNNEETKMSEVNPQQQIDGNKYDSTPSEVQLQQQQHQMKQNIINAKL